ncbi:structural cement protein Gp24 [Methylorubrum suomiense]|uniref:Bacteriophage protein n=1 Tax=Methylorubrum suomiense TaxID=144191 RepID=A0ABQ4UY66_9HYPH|nr:hypothetical protein [Methylorubrum suomiense]GJE77276.1 hypothetical protein BGCPKDLD_3879 [Methylorubrum suomiense]
MPFPTISYDRIAARGYPGMVYSTEGADADISLVIGATSADVAPGLAMVFDTLEGTAKLPTAGGKFAGIAVVDRTLPFSNGNVFKPYDQVTGKRAGAICVQAPGAVAQGDPVYFVNATGALTNVAGSGANTLIENAEWIIPTTGAAISAVRLAVSK